MRTIILLLFYVVATILLIPLFLFCRLFNTPGALILYGKGVVWFGYKMLGFRLDVRGIENIDKTKPCILMPNHQSLIDGPLILYLGPKQIRVILKKEIFGIPIIGMAMKVAKFIPVDRKREKGGKHSINLASHLIKEKGYSFLIFPEGTRSRDGKLLPFKRGGFYLALESGASIVPVSIIGSFAILPKGKFFTKKGRIKVIFHPSVSVQGLGEKDIPELSNKIRDIIQAEL